MLASCSSAKSTSPGTIPASLYAAAVAVVIAEGPSSFSSAYLVELRDAATRTRHPPVAGPAFALTTRAAAPSLIGHIIILVIGGVVIRSSRMSCADGPLWR